MMNTNRSSFKLSMLALTLVLPGTFGIRTWGQKAPPITVGDKKITGVPEDWSFHHIVFPNPGPEENAIRNGTQKKWLGIVNDPRYVLQQLQRRSPAEGPAAAAVSNWLNQTDENAKKGAPSSSKSKTKIDKDWTMILGNGSAAASLIGTIGTVSSSTVSASSTLTIDGQTFTASAPTAATQTGTFTGNPANGQTVTIGGTESLAASLSTPASQMGTFASPPAASSAITVVNGSNTLTLKTNGTGASVLGTASGTPTASTAISVTSGSNTLTLSNGGTAASVIGTFSAPPTTSTTISVTSGSNTLGLKTNATTASYALTFTGHAATTQSITITYTGGATSNTLTMTGGTSNSCSGSGTTTGTFNATSSTTTTRASNFYTAISMCPTAIGVTSSNPGGFSSAITLTAALPGNFLTVTNSLTNTSGTLTAGGNGSATCGSSTSGTFATSNSTATLASNLSAAINACNTAHSAVGATSSYTSPNSTFTVTATTPGNFTFSGGGGATGIFSWGTVTAGTNGSSACTSSNTGTYATSNATTTLASNLSAAINTCNSSFPAVGATSSYTSGSTFTVTGTPGNFTPLSVAGGATGIFSWGTVTAGTNGSNSCTSSTAGFFATSSSTTTLASNLSAAINACPTGTGLTNSSTSSGSTVTVTASAWGISSITLTPTSGFFAWHASTLAGGTNGTNTGTSFAIDNVLADAAANLAAAITRNGSAVGVSASSSGAQLTVTATAGTGGNGITLAESLNNFAWTAGALAGGTNGTDSTSTFAYWSGSAYDTPSQLASDIATAVAANSTVTAVITTAANSPGSGNVTFTANTAGTGGNGYEVSANNFSAFSPTSANLSGGGSGGLQLNAYPAKYSFSTATASCNDYVVYPTGLDGGTGQASVVAYSNLYVNSTCSNIGPVPSIYFAYNTPVDGNSSAAASLSPVLSLDGTQVAYVEVANGVASLVILRMANSGGTIDNPVGINYEPPGSYSGCSAPCYTTLTFNGNPNDTNSSPFVNYFGSNSDLYVGDDSGKVHHFTGVFSGNPAESTGNWPVSVSSNTLTGVVFDQSNSFLYVGDSGGFLYSINTSNQAFVKSGQIATGNGIVDAPLIDSAPATPTVYAFVGDDNSARSGVYQFAANFASGTKGLEENMGGSSGSTSTTVYDGAFDNLHYDISAGTGGSLYVCAGTAANPLVPSLYRIVMNSGFTGAVSTVGNGPAIGNASCSPVTEFLGSKANTTLSAAINNSTTTIPVASGTGIANNDYIQIDSEIMKVASGGGTTTLTVGTRGGTGALGTAAASHPINEAVQDIQDWAFLGVTANGFDTGCTGSGGVPGCLFNYSITTGPPSAAATGVSQTGGTSGIIIDNLSTAAGASQIYFNSLGIESCAGNGPTGGGSGGCAVQASQSVP